MGASSIPPTGAARASGALDLILYAVAVGVGILVFAGVRIAEILGSAGPAVTVPADDLVTAGWAGADASGVSAVTMHAPAIDGLGRFWFVMATLVIATAAVIVMLSLVRVALAVRSGRMFTRRAQRGLVTIGITLTAAAFAWPLVDGLGRERALASLGIPYEPLHFLELLPLAPVFVAALTAGVLAAAFTHGERLQRDTEGLV